MPIDNEPRALAASMLSEIITDIRASRPTRSDGSTTTGYVYCQMVPGLMVSPRDFAKPWSPIGGVAELRSGQRPAAGANEPAESVSPIIRRAYEAAFKTFNFFDKLLMVTDDGTTQYYSGGGRHAAFQYENILRSMTAKPAPPRSPEEQAHLDDATAVLEDAEGNDTPKYARYKKNRTAYAKAIGDLTAREITLLNDPEQGPAAGALLLPLSANVDDAREKWMSQGAAEVEAALATRASVGVPLGEGAILRAKNLFEAWQAAIPGIAGGLAGRVPYTYIFPSEWSQIETQDIGWTTLKHESRTYRTHFEKHGNSLNVGNWSGSSESSSGSAGIGVFGFGFAGSYSEWESQSNSSYSNSAHDGTTFSENATNLSIELEYGICEISRPWLVTDIFHLNGWYLPGQRKGAVSSGHISDQVGDHDKLLPMLPTAIVVVRNVRITAENWGSDKTTLENYWSNGHRSDSSGGESIGGSASVPVFSFLSLTGGYRRDESHYQGDFRDEAGNDVRNDFGAFFEGNTLVINGAQVVGWLGEIIPVCPPEDDPNLPD